jgi:plasmid stabilization system protein ParE
MLDEAVAYVAQEARPAAERLLVDALNAAASLDVLSGRGRAVPEWDEPAVREIFIQRYRLLCQVSGEKVHVLAFIHAARDLTRWLAERRPPSR